MKISYEKEAKLILEALKESKEKAQPHNQWFWEMKVQEASRLIAESQYKELYELWTKPIQN